MLLDGGARVLVTGRSQAGLDAAQKEIGKDASWFRAIARSLSDLDALAVRAKAELAAWTYSSSTPALASSPPLEHTTEATFDEMFNLNAKGPFFACRNCHR
jgi:NAD(P)-dependent dehydrogenase (short-subunit alcohol dehydrogenase family)